jgi:hypothetical protein
MQAIIRIKGTKPLIVHDNSHLANPLDEITKAIKVLTGKTPKTEADLLEISRLEWVGSLYYNSDLGPIMPMRCLKAMLRSAAKKQKLGKIIQESVFISEDVPILYDGPRDITQLWKDGRFIITVPAKVGGSIVMRTRPIFKEWEIEFVIDFEETQLNPEVLKNILTVAGLRTALCDWRPEYGRFSVEEFKLVK